MPHVPDHQSDHDPLLIAAFAAGDAAGPDLERAQALVATCDECAALHHDLRAIAAAMPAVPAPTRTRDFRLTPGQAQELRPSAWRRLLAPLAGPRFAFAAPLGGSLAALGLAGVLVAGAASTPIAPGVTSTGTGGSGAAAVRDATAGAPGANTAATDLPGPVATAAPAGPLPAIGAAQPSALAVQPGVAAAASAAASGGSLEAVGAGPSASADAEVDNVYGIDGGAKVPAEGSAATATSDKTLSQRQAQAPAPPSPLLAGAALLFVVGGLLAVTRWLAGRVA